MDTIELIELIREFQQSVKEVVIEFYNVYGEADLLTACRSNKIIPRKGKLNSKVYKYAFHGIGLYAKTKGKEVDFDFGPDNRTDGFDAWRLNAYLESQKVYKGLWSYPDLQIGLAKLASEGIIWKYPDASNYYFSEK
ncbi:MAG: hypothetical protein V4592_11845 [Bacteroidota bacterium]